jgi:hypothetical protein
MKKARGRLLGYPQELIDPEALTAMGCRREVHGRVAQEAIPAEAQQLLEELLKLAGTEQPAVAFALGFEFDSRRLKPEELLRRLICAVLLHDLGSREMFASPVAYQTRARWDLYAPDLETLIALNHLVEEPDVIQHVMHHHARTVFWAPTLVDRRPPVGWYLLRYTALQPWPQERNWFDEVVRQNERQSAEKRELTVSVRRMEDRLGAVRSLLGRLYAVLDAGEYLTLAEEV